jgi:hypothetical protein
MCRVQAAVRSLHLFLFSDKFNRCVIDDGGTMNQRRAGRGFLAVACLVGAIWFGPAVRGQTTPRWRE